MRPVRSLVLLLAALCLSCGSGPEPQAPGPHQGPPPKAGQAPEPGAAPQHHSPDAGAPSVASTLHPLAYGAALRALEAWLESEDSADLERAAASLDKALAALPHEVDEAVSARIRLYQAFVAERRGDPDLLARMIGSGQINEDGYHFVFAPERRHTLLRYHLLQACQVELTALQEALDHWAASHGGSYPEDLGALVPSLLPRAPTCPATGEPYQPLYGLQNDGHSYTLACPSHRALDGTALHISGHNGRERNLWEDGDVEQKYKILHMASGSFLQTGRRDVFLEPLAKAGGLAPGLVVADIGAGPGMFSFPFAQRVAPGGTVLAVDINASIVEYLEFTARRHPELPVQAHLSEVTSLGLPADSLDVAYVIQTYHANLDQGRPGDPQVYRTRVRPFLDSIGQALKPGGTLVIQDGAAKIPTAMLIQQVQGAGFELVSSEEGWDQQFLVVFRWGG
jgi:SAM-dependent methyltransferase